jgi:hypothetical protein
MTYKRAQFDIYASVHDFNDVYLTVIYQSETTYEISLTSMSALQ